MKYIIFAITLSAVLFSCTKHKPTCDVCEFTCISEFNKDVFTKKCPPKYDCEISIEPLMAIDTSTESVLVTSDSSFVVTINSFTEGSKYIIDDEITYILNFQVNNDAEEFYLENEELEEIKLIYSRECECILTLNEPIRSGCLQGKKIDDTWFFQGSLTLQYFNGNYEFDY